MLGTVEAFLIYFLNGLTFEFGDDLFCWAQNAAFDVNMSACRREVVRYVGNLGIAHAYAAFAGTLIGYAVTPLSVVLSAIAGKPKNSGEAFMRGLCLELVEGGLSVLGQVITDGMVGPAMWSLGLSVVIAPVRGTVAALTYSWLHSAVFRFLVVVGVLCAIAIVLHRIGLLPI